MKFGGIELEGRVLLAPMAGVTNLSYRRFLKPFGVALTVSEMISDCGLVYGNKQTFEYLRTAEDERPVALQLFGSSLESTVKAVEILEKNATYDILDLNLGCPVYKVTKTGAGSSWLRRPDELFEYLKGICDVSKHPVTIKIRLGWDQEHINVHEVVQLAEKAGVQGITIHARTTKQLYSGQPQYELIRDIQKETSVPIAVSGDIFTVEDAIKAMEITGAHFVMVARGALGNPQLVRQINEKLNGEPVEEALPLSKQLELAEQYADMLIADIGAHRAIPQLRGILPHFFSGFPGYKKIRLSITESLKSENDLERIWAGIRAHAQFNC